MMQRHGEHIPFVDSGSYPLRAGNRAAPLVDGEPAFRRICEAVESAKKSVWLTIAFLDPRFEMPDARGSLFDVLDAAVDRGLDVRVIFWRHWELAKFEPDAHFAGTEADRAMLAARNSRFLARWDQAHGHYCQHQKSWLVDAGAPGEVGFVGGINLHPGSMVPVGHPATALGDSHEGNVHDVYLEISGPSVTDVYHNFVQRWNESSDRDETDGLWPDASSQDLLSFPEISTAPIGDAHIQIQRTIRRGRYSDGRAVPGGAVFDIESGEFAVIDQYLKAIDAAKRTIYIEDQAIGSSEVVEALDRALRRKVEVVFLVPKDANTQMAAGRKEPASKAFFDSLGALRDHENFTLAGIVQNVVGGGYQNIYVHAKIALVDDVWCTIGSTNIGNRSFYGDTELNASVWHGPTVSALRSVLFQEHLSVETDGLSDLEALRLFAQISRANAERHARGEKLEGLALALDPTTYGE